MTGSFSFDKCVYDIVVQQNKLVIECNGKDDKIVYNNYFCSIQVDFVMEILSKLVSKQVHILKLKLKLCQVSNWFQS